MKFILLSVIASFFLAAMSCSLGWASDPCGELELDVPSALSYSQTSMFTLVPVSEDCAVDHVQLKLLDLDGVEAKSGRYSPTELKGGVEWTATSSAEEWLPPGIYVFSAAFELEGNDGPELVHSVTVNGIELKQPTPELRGWGAWDYNQTLPRYMDSVMGTQLQSYPLDGGVAFSVESALTLIQAAGLEGKHRCPGGAWPAGIIQSVRSGQADRSGDLSPDWATMELDLWLGAPCGKENLVPAVGDKYDRNVIWNCWIRSNDELECRPTDEYPDDSTWQNGNTIVFPQSHGGDFPAAELEVERCDNTTCVWEARLAGDAEVPAHEVKTVTLNCLDGTDHCDFVLHFVARPR